MQPFSLRLIWLILLYPYFLAFFLAKQGEVSFRGDNLQFAFSSIQNLFHQFFQFQQLYFLHHFFPKLQVWIFKIRLCGCVSNDQVCWDRLRNHKIPSPEGLNLTMQDLVKLMVLIKQQRRVPVELLAQDHTLWWRGKRRFSRWCGKWSVLKMRPVCGRLLGWRCLRVSLPGQINPDDVAGRALSSSQVCWLFLANFDQTVWLRFSSDMLDFCVVWILKTSSIQYYIQIKVWNTLISGGKSRTLMNLALIPVVRIKNGGPQDLGSAIWSCYFH